MRRFREKQVAERWNISPRTLQQWRWQGRGPRYMKVGAAVVYGEEDLEAYERENLHRNTGASLMSSGEGAVDER
jgi:hypothetical protein